MLLPFNLVSRSFSTSSFRSISSFAISQQIKKQKASAATKLSSSQLSENQAQPLADYQNYLNPTIPLDQDKLDSHLNTPSQNISFDFLLNNTPYTMNGVFAIKKPAGPTSADAVAALKGALNSSQLVEGSRAWAKANGLSSNKNSRNFNWKKKQRRKYRDDSSDQINDVKVGHGGTLDPLASGVVVIGIGNGTRKLHEFLTECTKVYEAVAVFGASTTTYDVTGNILEYADDVQLKVTEDSIKDAIAKSFTGNIVQYPPVYSALKMDGKRLYEYAREGVPLPRKIEARDVTVEFFEVVPNSVKIVTKEELSADDGGIASIPADEEEKKFYLRETMPPVGEKLREDKEPEKYVLAKLRFAVSSGTYIRSLIHDLARGLGVAAYMQKLERVRQGPFVLEENVFDLYDFVTHVRGTSREKIEKVLHKGQNSSDSAEVSSQDLTEEQNREKVKSNTSRNGYTDKEWVAMIKKMVTDGPNLKTADIKIQIAQELEKQDKEKPEEPVKSVEPTEATGEQKKAIESAEVTGEQAQSTESTKVTEEVKAAEPTETIESSEQEHLEGPPAKKAKTEN